MFKNYFTIAIRSLRRNKVFTGINVLGLAIGISASLVIYLLVNYHFTFDKFESNPDRIYRVVSNFTFSGENYHNSGVTDPMAAAVRKEIPGVSMVVPFRLWNDEAKISIPGSRNQQEVFKHQKNIVFADRNFFGLVPYQWIAGSAKTSLLNPYQTVLTESSARLYFPKLSPAEVMGKELLINDTVRIVITGIVRDLEENTDFTFKTFISYATLEMTSLKPGNWANWNSTNGAQQLFVKLRAGNNPVLLEKQVTALYKRNAKQEPGDHSITWFTLQPLKDLHFNAEYGTYDLPAGNKPTLYGLLAVAAFLLVLGCINFINLTTALGAQRAKEIGIRKTMGSSKKQLVVQFLAETFLLTLVATLLSVVLTPLIIKAFSGFIPEGLHLSLAEQPDILLFLVALMVVVTLLSGFYPAMILSGYKPILVLKNQAYSGTARTRRVWLRKSLTISQFVIAQVFIMATILVSKQIHFSLNKDMGFKKNAILYFTTNYYDTVSSHKTMLMDKLKSIPGIVNISLCTNPPSSNNVWSSTMKYKDGKNEIEADVQQKFGDSNFLKLYGLKLMAGKNINTTDTVTSFLINETYAGVLGFRNPEQAVGKFIEWENKRVPIVGVVSDFLQRSLHEPMKPLVVASWGKLERNFSIALAPQNESGTAWKTSIGKIEKAFKEVYPESDFEYSFFDEDIAKYYTAEQNISSLLKWATGLAIAISCLGLLGLVIYTTTQRTKEIGVRKVLGASVLQIVGLLSRDFILLVMFAFLIAAPLAWFGMNRWLQNFAFRTDISWWIFFAGAATMVLISLLTLSYQTIRAAIANPVESLKTE